MERYENLGLVGEGSYGMVLKCKHKETGQIVAIKKFIESEDDKMVKKIALREIKMLKQLRHENLVNLLEVFRRKKRLFLVFEFVDRTVLDDLEKYPDGLEEVMVKKISFQVLRGLEFCHRLNIIHRDVKPENILISKTGIVKLCDFGFARTLAIGPGEVYTDYVATRWYRAPELLVGDVNYGKAVDIWAVGCLLYEIITGDPLFPGDSDIDQLFHITKVLGNLTKRHQETFHKNPLFSGMRMPSNKNADSIGKQFTHMSQTASDLIMKSLAMDASMRLSCLEMMKHEYYQNKNFAQTFLESLNQQVEKETTTNPFLKSLAIQKSNKFYNNNNNNTLQETKAKGLEINSNSNDIKDSVSNSQEKKKKKDNTKNTDENCHELTDKKQKQNEQLQQQISEYQLQQPILQPQRQPQPQQQRLQQQPVLQKSQQQQQQQQKPMQQQQQQQQRQRSKDNINEGIQRIFNSENLCGLEPINKNLNSNEKTTKTSKHTAEGSNRKISPENLSKQDFEASEMKHINRTPLDLSINQLGKNLPEICSTANINRARGYEVIKQKKTHSKKLPVKSEREIEGSMLYPVAEKATIYPDHQSKSIEELIKSDKYKRKDSKIREPSELEFPKVSGLTLPSVKGAELKKTKTSPTRGSKRMGLTSTIPHIQNIDPFSTTSPSSKEPSSHINTRIQRDGNLPAM